MSSQGGTDGALRIICPTCEELLSLEDVEEVAAGQPVRTFCPSCERTVEVTAPKGIEAYVDSQVDRVDRSTVTEFTVTGPGNGK